MPLNLAERHPVFQRAREAARSRPEFRVARPVTAVTRLSNAPVRMVYGSAPSATGRQAIVVPSSPAERHVALGPTDSPEVPTEMPPPTSPHTEPAPAEVTDIPPSSIPLPTHQPPGMTPPIA